MRHSGSVELSYLWWEWPVLSLVCIGNNRARWAAVDGIDSRYRLAAYPVSLHHADQFPSTAGLAVGVNMRSSLSSSYPWYGISLLSSFYSASVVSVPTPLLNMAGER
jgi:hypothetical protein